MNYDTLEREVQRWAIGQDEIRALIVVGSRARNDHMADTASDLDFMFFVTAATRYVKNTEWLNKFGDVLLKVQHVTDAGDQEWLVLYDNGRKVDYFLATATGPLSAMLASPLYLGATRRGVRVLLDKDNQDDQPQPYPVPAADWARPSQEEFDALLQQFWLYAFRAAGMLKRGDLWRARVIIDSTLRSLLLQMLSWHAKSERGDETDTWYDGRFLTEWADPQAAAALPKIFALYDKEATIDALIALIDLMGTLGKETAANWQYTFPSATESRARQLMNLSGRHPAR